MRIDEKIKDRWQRVIDKETVKKWSDIAKKILSKKNTEFIMIISQNEMADYTDIKKMTLFLDICSNFNAILEFI